MGNFTKNCIRSWIYPYFAQKSGKAKKIGLSQRESALTRNPSLSTQKKDSLTPPMGYKSCPLANRDCPKMRDVGRIWTFYATFGKFFHRNSRANVWQIQKVEKYFFEIGLELYFYNNSHPPQKKSV